MHASQNVSAPAGDFSNPSMAAQSQYVPSSQLSAGVYSGAPGAGTGPMGGSNAHMHGGVHSMHVGDASTTSSASNAYTRHHTAGSLQTSQGATLGSTGQQGGSLADVYQAAYPTQAGGTTFAATMAGPQAAPGPGASSESKQEHVQYQIDSLKDGEVLDGLILHQGLRTRLLGGTSSPFHPVLCCIQV